ncbi:MAG: fused DSP-PTPase phosphatase/NAD kinase-like protein [Planctomycetota bacterium]
MPIERPGLPNLHQVTPAIYRSAQPSDAGFVELERMGVRTVLSLRAFHADTLPIGSSLERERISFKSWHPEAEDVERFFRCVMDPSRHPVLVHCQHGADRTGMMLALYRIAAHGWSKDEAIREMVEGGYGFHSIWTNLVEYVRAVDVEELRELARISHHALLRSRQLARSGVVGSESILADHPGQLRSIRRQRLAPTALAQPRDGRGEKCELARRPSMPSVDS